MLNIKRLSVSIDDREIVKDFSLTVKQSEIHALMGPNGSGKSTLSLTLAGHPSYVINPNSHLEIDGEDITIALPEERSQKGLFLSFQHPIAIPGLSVQHLLKIIWDHTPHSNSHDIATLRKDMEHYCQLLNIPQSFLSRSVNDNFSGGEKKRLEMLQLLIAKPKIAILDEIDSGLDVDAIKIIAKAASFAREEFRTGFIIVTHYRRILDHIKPDFVHVLVKGKLVESSNANLIETIEKSGYQRFTSQQGV